MNPEIWETRKERNKRMNITTLTQQVATCAYWLPGVIAERVSGAHSTRYKAKNVAGVNRGDVCMTSQRCADVSHRTLSWAVESAHRVTTLLLTCGLLSLLIAWPTFLDTMHITTTRTLGKSHNLSKLPSFFSQLLGNCNGTTHATDLRCRLLRWWVITRRGGDYAQKFASVERI